MASHLSSKKTDPKVVVIGAGLAGLTTAYRLHRAGINVSIYEARARVGGRVFTASINEQFGELGAQNITDGGDAVHINHLLNEFNLETVTSRVNLRHDYFDGEKLTAIPSLLINNKFDPDTLKEQLNELAKTSKNMKDVLGKIVDEKEPLYKILAVRLAAYEGATIEKLSPIYIETLYHMLLGGICAVHQATEEDNFVDIVSIKGGNSLLPEALANLLRSKIHLNSPLIKVNKTKENLFNLVFANLQEVQADIIILAIPCSVYSDIIFEDDVIPLEKLKAIENVEYGANAKILLPFPKPPSKTTGLISDQIVSFFDTLQNLLTIYCTDKTSYFSKDTIKEAYNSAKPMIEIGFGADFPSMETPTFADDKNFQKYKSAVGYSWPNDPYAKGSYSCIAAGQEFLLNMSQENSETFRTLFAPIEENLYFAGEHTSILTEVPGTMEAACESGERIARAILSNYGK